MAPIPPAPERPSSVLCVYFSCYFRSPDLLCTQEIFIARRGLILDVRRTNQTSNPSRCPANERQDVVSPINADVYSCHAGVVVVERE